MKPARHHADDPAPLTADELRGLLPTLRSIVARIEATLREPEPETVWMSTHEAAKLAHVASQQAVRDWARKFALGRRRGRQWEINRDLLLAFLKDRAGRVTQRG